MEELKNTEAVVEENKVDYELEYKRLKEENERLKTANTKTSADVSKYKKELSEHLSKEELSSREQAEAMQKMRDELETYKNRERISNYKSKLMEVGYDAETASSMASGLPDGVSDDFFTSAKDFHSKSIAKVRADILNEQPTLTAGETMQGVAKDKDLDAFLRGAGLLY